VALGRAGALGSPLGGGGNPPGLPGSTG